MSKINLTNWEIVDEMQNGEVVIRSKVTGKELRLHQSGELITESIDNNGIIETDTLDSTSIDNAGTVTTQDIVVNGTATGAFGGAPVLESGDSVTVKTIGRSTSDDTLVTLFDGVAKDVLGGTVTGGAVTTFEYTFADNTVLNKNTGQTGYTQVFSSRTEIEGGSVFEVDFLPPAKDVTKVEVGHNRGGQFNQMGAEIILKD